jgi:acetylglutamate kinase
MPEQPENAMHRIIDQLYDAAPYIGKFQGSVFVVKIGGEILLDKRALESLGRQLTVMWQLGIRPVVVHGGGPQLDKAMEAIGHQPRKVNGRRVTDAQTLELAKREFRGAANLDLVAAFAAQGLPAVGLSGADGGILLLRRRAPVPVGGEIVDFGFVGDPVKTAPQLIRTLVRDSYMPVIASLACDASGQILNVNADTVAAELAVALSASKLIFVTDKPGILHDEKDPESVYSVLDAEECRKLVAEGVIAGGMQPKVAAALDALERGLKQVHIVGAHEENALLEETFTNQGCGTMILLRREGN